MMENDSILEVRNLSTYFPAGRNIKGIKAIDDISFSLRKGEILGIAGESGCGKTTLVRSIAQLYRPTSGSVYFRGRDLCSLDNRTLSEERRYMQMVFQNPYSSLDPKMRVKDVLREPMEIYQKRGWMKKMRKKEMDEITHSSLNSFGIDESLFERKIKYLSGGEREKVYLMSALMVEPRLLLLDEALASLDEESSENLINELFAKSEEYNFALVFVSHNYKLVERIADKIYILEDGKLTRVAPS